MVQHEQQQIESADHRIWMRLSMVSALLGGVLITGCSLYMLTVLTVREFTMMEPFGVLGSILLALGLPAYYASERRWFGRAATVSFGVMATGTVIAAITIFIATYSLGVAFLGYLLGVLVLVLGAVAFGVVMLRADASPRLGAWLLIATLPIGLPFALGFTTYVMGQTADPWAGPLAFYGLAWIVFGSYLWKHPTGATATKVASQ